MEVIKGAFTKCKAEGRTALITCVTAGYPTVDKTLEIMLSMQAGGAGTRRSNIVSHDPVTRVVIDNPNQT